MEISKWKKRRLTPTWGGNDEEPEPCVIVFAPPSVGWMARWRELAIQVPNLKPDSVADDGYLKEVADWSAAIHSFRDELLGDLVLAVDNLTLNDKAVSLEEGLAFILDNEGLREEVFLAIVAEGTMTAPEGKD